ncbi:MAG: hypothetical protein JXQ96_17400 [Cyclobacteriaceae bacterium]
MDTQVVKQTIHELVEQIDDNELLDLYLRLLKREFKKEEVQKEFFTTTDSEQVARAKSSMRSIEQGDTRNINDFKKDVQAWKKNRAI